jgi:Trk K+ transport system NAD-binding subunit
LDEFQDPSRKAILICGLGRLGQHCALLLKELGIPVFGVHDVEPKSCETDGLAHLLDRFTMGDCRRHSVLERAGIASCRAALFTTSDERANISGAVAARSLNSGIRLVIRSSQTNLNDRLTQQLGNLAALDVAELPATAFTLAAIGNETVGLLALDGQFLRVVEKRVEATNPWAEGRDLHDLNTRSLRVLHHSPGGNRQPINFHGWDPSESVRPGDILAYIEFYRPASVAESAATEEETVRRPALTWNSIRSRISRLWTGSNQIQRVAALTTCTLILLHATGVMLYKLEYPQVSLLEAFNVATVSHLTGVTTIQSAADNGRSCGDGYGVCFPYGARAISAPPIPPSPRPYSAFQTRCRDRNGAPWAADSRTARGPETAGSGC